MASTAPGQTASHNEAVCYNCGVTGHWVMACPEPTRNKPAGLERWKSQHQDHGASTERSGLSHEKKGPIVTRYPLPPGQVPPVQRYGPPPPFPPAGGPPLPPQPYGQPGYPTPPPYATVYPPPPPPQYGHYQAPLPIPTPHQYTGAQAPAYGQPQYPPSYPPAPPPPPPAATGYYAGAPPPPPTGYQPGGYPPQLPFGAPPPPPPPPPSNAYPSPYATGAPPPPPDYRYPVAPAPGPSYVPPPSNPPSYQQPQPPPPPPPPGTSFDRPPGLPPRPPPPVAQTPPNNQRGKHQRRHGKRGHRDRNRHKNDDTKKNGRDRRERQRERQAATSPPAQRPPQEEAGGSPVPEIAPKQEDGEWDPASEQELKKIFPEIKTKPADPVGIPLPAEYSDLPTIPPAYDAKCVKSEFFNDGNGDEFARSVRDKADWSEARWDPIFKPYPGMVVRIFPGYEDLEFRTYDPPRPLSPDTDIKMPPRFRINRSASPEHPESWPRDEAHASSRHEHSRYRSPGDFGYRVSPSDRHRRNSWDGRRSAKRPRDYSPEDVERGVRSSGLKRSRNSDTWRDTPRNNRNGRQSPVRRKAMPSPEFGVGGDPWSPQAGEGSLRASIDPRYLDVSNDGKSSSSREDRAPYNTNTRHDSGYHSGQSLDNRRGSYPNDERGRPPERSAPRRKSPSRSRSGVSSAAERSGRSRSESPLTALEAELLGIADEPVEPRVPRMKAKKPLKRVKVAAAFSRRW